ncbi:MAG: 3-hydroxyacyl-CoA dehydrogenase [Thermodesulfobacteriota bacterium]
MKLEGIGALITGGASGLGEAAARELMSGGARCALLDLDEAKGAALASALGGGAVFFKTDVTDEASVKAAVDGTIARFGAIHVVVNCAGIGLPAKVLGKEGPMSLSVFTKVIQVNLVGTFNVIRLAAARMTGNPPNADGERGVIINTSSVAAFEGQIGQASYSASKAAVAGMTLPIAREFAELGLRVVTVAPGLFDTPMLASLPDHVREALGQMVPFPKRLGRPAEYAALVRHIVENPMINGETIRLDGAIRMAAR